MTQAIEFVRLVHELWSRAEDACDSGGFVEDHIVRSIERYTNNVEGYDPHDLLVELVLKLGREARNIINATDEDGLAEDTNPIEITDNMVHRAAEALKTSHYSKVRRMMVEVEAHWRGTPDVTSDNIVEWTIERYDAARKAWRAQGSLRGEAWKKANPNWRGST